MRGSEHSGGPSITLGVQTYHGSLFTSFPCLEVCLSSLQRVCWEVGVG